MQNLISISSLLASAVLFLISIFVYSRGMRRIINISFFLYFFVLAVWSFGIYGLVSGFEPTILIWLKIMCTGVVFIPSTFLFFVFNLLDANSRPRTSLVIAAFVISSIYLVLTFTPYLFMGVAKVHYGYVGQPFPCPIFPLFVAYVVASMIYGHYCVYHELKYSRGRRLNQLLYFFTASAAFTIGALAVVPTLVGLVILGGFPLWNFTNILYSFLTAYAILRHRLMDIEVVIKRSFVYSVLVALIVGVYALGTFALQEIFGNMIGFKWLLATIGAAIIAIGFRPLEILFTDLSDRYFFKKKYDYHQTLKDLSRGMAELTNLERLAKLIVRIVERNMKLEGAMLMVYDYRKSNFRTVSAQGRMKAQAGMVMAKNDPLIKYFDQTSNILMKEDLVHELGREKLTDDFRSSLHKLLKEMDKCSAVMCVPSKIKEKLIGLLMLADKKSQDAYSSEDISLLQTLAPQAAVAIKNAMTYDEIRKDLEAEHGKVEMIEQQLVKSQHLASLGTLAAGVAHEIRNPMQALRMKAEALAEKAADHPYIKEAAEVLIKNADRVLMITKEMLDLSKQKDVERKPVNVNETIESVTQFIQFRNIKLFKELGDVPRVSGDPQQLSQVMINLIENAIKAMPHGGSIIIKTYSAGQDVNIDIIDTGIGITPENLVKIFDPFFTTHAESTGLGLSISYKIIREHGGSIKVKSEVGKGSTFTVSIPALRGSS